MIGQILGFVKEIIKPATDLVDNLTTTTEEKMQLKAEIMKI